MHSVLVRINSVVENLLPEKLKRFAMAFFIGVTCVTYCRARQLCLALTKTPSATGSKEIFRGTHALLPKRGFFVADVGAYRGWYTALASKIVGSDGHIYSFEPEPTNFRMLLKVISLNKLRNVTPFRLALSDKDGLETLYVSPKYPTMHSIVMKRGNKSINVSARELDTLVKTGEISRLDLIKIDVEGAELEVLKGASTTIERIKPILSIEVNHYENELEDIKNFIEEYDYKTNPLCTKDGTVFSIVCFPNTNR